MASDPQPAQDAECPDEDRFAAFVDGSLDPAHRTTLQAHFEGCARCSDALGLMVGAFDDDVGPTRSRDTKTGSNPSPTSLAGPFADRYEILQCVGLGAGGTVYSAYDPQLERVVALKVLRGGEPRADGSTQPEEKWTREAKAMAKVVHPNVVAVHDVGVADDHVFIATEFVEGGSLEDWFREGPRPWSAVVALFVQAGLGLAAIHARGLVHRDFKPHNVLVGIDGRPRVTDFGLARLLPERDDPEGRPTAEHVLASVEIGETIATQTRTGMLVGTPAYMSPEQWRGKPADARSDQFSFCVALYQGLWGQRPFRGSNSLELADRVCRGEVQAVPSASKVPRWLRRVVQRGLSLAPEDRYPSMDALLDALRDAPGRVRQRRTAGALVVGFASVAGLGYAVAGWKGEPCPRDDARFVGVWDDATHGEVGGAWSDPALVAAVTERLDAWVTQWHTTSEEACRAAKIDATIDAYQHELQGSCLERRFAELQAASGALRTVDAERVLDVLDAMGSPERCADAEALVRIEPSWGSAEARALATEMAADLARCRSLRAEGEFDSSLSLATALVARAQENGDPAVRAEALTELGLAQSALKQGADALQTLRDAVWAAEASGHVAMATAAWLETVEVLVSIIEDYPEAERAMERADAAAHRLGDEEQLLHLRSSRGLLQSNRGDYEAALATHTAVIADAEKVFGPNHPQVARMSANMAAVLSHVGRMDEALAYAQRGVAIFDNEVSDTHPELVQLLNTVGALQLQLQDIPAARKTLTRALKIAELRLSDDSPILATVYGNLAYADGADKQFDAAIAGYTKVLALHRAAHGNEHPDVALALHNLAAAIDNAGDPKRAIEVYREALTIRLASLGSDHPGTAGTQHNLGLLVFLDGDVDAGIALMEKARSVREAHQVDPYLRASTRFMLARAYQAKGDLEQALAYAREAVVQLRSIAPRQASVLTHIETWIAKYQPKG